MLYLTAAMAYTPEPFESGSRYLNPCYDGYEDGADEQTTGHPVTVHGNFQPWTAILLQQLIANN